MLCLDLAYYWKSSGIHGQQQQHNNSRVQQSSSFTSLNPEAAVFSPSQSPERQIAVATSQLQLHSYPNNSSAGHSFPHNFAPFQNSHMSGHQLDAIGGGVMLHGAGGGGSFSVNFQDDTHLHSNSLQNNVIGVNHQGARHRGQAAAASFGGGGGAASGAAGGAALNSLLSPTQRFYPPHSNGLHQLQFHQQTFRGGSPVDYGAPQAALHR